MAIRCTRTPAARWRAAARAAARGALALLTAALLALLPATGGQGGNEPAFAATAASQTLVKGAGAISQYDNGSYVHDFRQGVLGVNGELAFCMDPNINFKSGTVSSADILSVVSPDQLSDIALRSHYVQNVYADAPLSYNARVLVAQTLVWEVVSPSQSFVVVPAESGGSLPELTAAVRDDAMAKARAFSAAQRHRYRAFGTLWLNGATQPVATLGCELVLRDGLAKLAKHDAESGWSDAFNGALGGATLKGARYSVDYYEGVFRTAAEAEASGAPERRWEFETAEGGVADLGDPESCLVSGTLFRDGAGRPAFPVGTYVLREVAPSEGYLVSEAAYVVVVRQDGAGTALEGDLAHAGGSALVVDAEQVKRGDLCLTKVREADMARLAGVPFRLTSETTGESHVLATDANGRIDTAASWNPHTSRTNANDGAVDAAGAVDPAKLDAEAGVWFGLRPDGSATAPDDALGALPFDTYTLEELRCPANEGLSLVKLQGIVAKRHGTTVDLGTVDDRSDQAPSITTQAFDGLDLDKWVVADAAAEVCDHVEYMNLTPGQAYTLKATLFDPEAATELPGVEAALDFVAPGANGSVDVAIRADLSHTDAGRLVVFEELLCGGAVVAEHKDAGDLSQTVNVGTPNVTTFARDAHDGDKSVAAAPRAVVTDEIELVNLVPGRTYQVFGTVIDAETGLPALCRPADEGSGGQGGGVDASDGGPFPDGESPAGEPSPGGAIPQQEVRRFWNGLMDALGAVPRDEGGRTVYDIPKGQSVDMGAVGAYMEEQGAVASRMVLASTEVQADAARTVASLDYEMDASGLEGGYVIYDLLMSGDEVMAVHADPGNEMEAFDVEQPALDTQARDATDGDQELLPSLDSKVVDSVAYSGLMAGCEYALEGVLVDRSDGSVLHVDDKPVEARATFTANASSGTVSVEFRFDSSRLPEGTELVACEFLSKDGQDVAEHADLDDEDQTVRIGAVPAGKGYYKTGGADAPGPAAAVAAGAAAGACLFLGGRRLGGSGRA